MMLPRDGLSPPTPPLRREGRAQDSRSSRLPLPRAPSRISATLSTPLPFPRRRLSMPQAGGGDTAPAFPRRGRGSRSGEPLTPQGNRHPAPHLERRNQTLPPAARPPQPPSRTSKHRTLLHRPAPGGTARPRRAYSPPSKTGLTAKAPGSGGGSHSRSSLVLSLLDRHPRPESWLLGGENTAGGREEIKKHSASDTLTQPRGGPSRPPSPGRGARG